MANAPSETPRCDAIAKSAAYHQDVSGWNKYYDMERLARSLEKRVAALEAGLRPFANYACDPPCECHNCKARALLEKRT